MAGKTQDISFVSEGVITSITRRFSQRSSNDVMAKAFILALLSAILMAGCGSGDQPSGIARPPGDPQINGSTAGVWRLKSFDPLSIALSPASLDNPNVLVSTNRTLALYQYDQVKEPELNETKSEALTVITGLGMDALDLKGLSVKIGLGIEAREYDAATKTFGSQTRIFAAPGSDFSGAQSFRIQNADSSNYVLTGIGLRLRNARLNNLQIERKPLSALRDPGFFSGDSGTFIELPAGFAAVGILLKFTKNASEDPSPYVQDALLYTALWAQQ